MNTISKEQENRYLESPYVVKETGVSKHVFSNVNNSFKGGFSFSKSNLIVKSSNCNSKDKKASKDKLGNASFLEY
jgi:hypothetical protein